MDFMTQLRHWKALPILFLILFAMACSKAPTTASSDAEQQTPSSNDAADKQVASKLVPDRIEIPAGTAINIRLQSSLSSGTSQAGQSFDAVIDQPIVVNGRTIVPSGAEATGRVVAAAPGGRLHTTSYLKVTLASITINGKQVPVQTSSIAVQGASHKKRNLLLIGGGAGGGALLGGLLGGPKGALIGAGLGAGAGTGGAYATGKKEVGFAAERRLTFRLTRAFSEETT